MTRLVTVGAAQLGRSPETSLARRSSSASSPSCTPAPRRAASSRRSPAGAHHVLPAVVLPDQDDVDAWFERDMPSAETQPLFDAARVGVGFCLGFAELTPEGQHFNTQVRRRDGEEIARYRKVHLPGHEEHEPWRAFQHLERRYFDPGQEGFGVWRAFGGILGMMICNDCCWPERYRVLGLQGVELIRAGTTR